MIFVEDKHLNCYRSNGLLVVSLKMWRMDIFTRHNFGERENTVGHRCTRALVLNRGFVERA
jgi:hypothetical protein